MGILKLLEAAVKVATIPVSVVVDIVTLGGAITDQDKPYTVKKLEDISDDIDGIGD